MIDLLPFSQGLAKYCVQRLGGSARWFEVNDVCCFFAAPEVPPALEHLEALIHSFAVHQREFTLDLSSSQFGLQRGLLAYQTPLGPLHVEVISLPDHVAVLLQMAPQRSEKA